MNNKKNKIYALILAGGKGERLKPLTNTVPKPMIPILGKPMIWYQLKWLEKTSKYLPCEGHALVSSKFLLRLACCSFIYLQNQIGFERFIISLDWLKR